MKILDATCGARTMWYQKNHPFVTFMDKREGKIHTIENGNSLRCKRTLNINPDLVADWTKTLPFDDKHFDMVVFDPPHIIRKRDHKESLIEKRYGYLFEDNYKQELQKGISELFRVLKDNGSFILKWNENQVQIEEVLKLFPYPPLFGTRTGQRNKTHWILFLKNRIDESLFRFSPNTDKGRD